LREITLGISPAAPFALPANTRGEFNGGSMLGRWTRAFSDRSDVALQTSFDHFSRNLFSLADQITTVDLDFQHHVALGQRQDIVWGLGYRLISHQTESSNRTPVQFNPKGKSFSLFSGFAQDEIALVKDQLRLTLGVKLEHNDFSGFEAQPSLRLSWTPNARQTVWAAIARAVRTPARTDQDIRVNFQATPTPEGITAIVAAVGSAKAKSEVLRAYELGYRAQPGRKLSLDIATFYNKYHRLTSFEPGLPFFEADPLRRRSIRQLDHQLPLESARQLFIPAHAIAPRRGEPG
jgi:iron complex outermembrane receptor protein